jgi:hypothetical protein
MATQTPAQYAAACYRSGKHCWLMVEASLCGGYYLVDGDWKPLKSKRYGSRGAAETDRSRITARALKQYFKREAA